MTTIRLITAARDLLAGIPGTEQGEVRAYLIPVGTVGRMCGRSGYFRFDANVGRPEIPEEWIGHYHGLFCNDMTTELADQVADEERIA